MSEVLPEWSTRMMPFKDDTTNKEIKEKSLKCMIRPIGVSSYKLAEKNELPKELEGIKELEGLM